MKRRLLRYTGVSLCILVLAVLGFADGIRGTVSDSSGAVIPNAVVQLLLSGNVVAQTQTNSNGQFSFQVEVAADNGQTGTVYQVTATAKGFALSGRSIRLVPSGDVRVALGS